LFELPETSGEAMINETQGQKRITKSKKRILYLLKDIIRLMKTLTIIATLLFLCSHLSGQTITGNLSKLNKQEIKLEGFNGLKTYPISKTTLDDKGNFSLKILKI
jgi:ABC-type multidrug transport system ATPase subunit